MIVRKISEIQCPTLFYDANWWREDITLYLKMEGLNRAHSIKLKTAMALLKGVEDKVDCQSQKITVIESSSGNLGVALSILCKERGYPFICVTDPNISSQNEALMKAYGASVVKVTKTDENGGYLTTRIQYIEEALIKTSNLFWTNQYSNQDNIQAHFDTTAKEIFNGIKNIDYLFIGAGTTGTLMGCIQYFKKYSPATKIIAVDALGSVTFGYPAAKRRIPGIGTSLKPPISNVEVPSSIVLVKEEDTIKTAHQILKESALLLGASSCSVMHAIKQYAFIKGCKKPRVVAICPDFGEKYLETIYNKDWIHQYFGDIFKDIE